MHHDNSNRNFKGQLADEEVIAFTRKHWLRIIPNMLGLVFLLVAPIVLSVVLSNYKVRETVGEGGFFFLVGSYVLATTYAFHVMFVRIFNYFLRIFIVTNHRIVDLNKTLFFQDHRSTILLSEIQDVSMDKKGIWATIFNYGQIDVMISGSQQISTFRYLPNPDYQFRKIIKSRQEYILKLSTVNTHPQLVLPVEPLSPEPLKSIDYAGLF